MSPCSLALVLNMRYKHYMYVDLNSKVSLYNDHSSLAETNGVE